MPTAKLSQVLATVQDRTNQQNQQPQTSKPHAAQWQNGKPAPTCEICEGAGYYRLDLPFGHPQFGKAIRCECKAQEDAKRLQRLSGLHEGERNIRLVNIDTSRPDTARMVTACREFLAHPFQMVTIYGGPGNGKTMVLQAAVNQSLASGRRAVYVTSFDLISYIRAAFNPQDKKVIDEDAYSRLRRFEEIEILAIDEFDKVRMTEWVQEQITDLIDRRYRLAMEGQAGTLIAMNGDPIQLPDWIYSRLSDGRNQIINNTDNDLRPLIYHPHTNELIG